MLIAKVQNQQVTEVADYRDLFPNTSFAVTGPDDAFMVENSCMYVNLFKPYDQNTEKLVSVAPYIESASPTHWVYTVAVEPLTPEEIAQREESAKQRNKAQAESLLQETDWTEGKSVRDNTRIPHLVNGDEFDDYRVALRVIALNPPVTVDEWPVKPNEVWSTT